MVVVGAWRQVSTNLSSAYSVHSFDVFKTPRTAAVCHRDRTPPPEALHQLLLQIETSSGPLVWEDSGYDQPPLIPRRSRLATRSPERRVQAPLWITNQVDCTKSKSREIKRSLDERPTLPHNSSSTTSDQCSNGGAPVSPPVCPPRPPHALETRRKTVPDESHFPR